MGKLLYYREKYALKDTFYSQNFVLLRPKIFPRVGKLGEIGKISERQKAERKFSHFPIIPFSHDFSRLP